MGALPPKPSRRRKASTLSSVVARVTEAAIAFRQGSSVLIRDTQSKTLALAVETLDDAALADLKGPAYLVLTHPRARTLKIRLYTQDVAAVSIDGAATANWLRAIADPTHDLAEPLKGPFAAVRGHLPASYAASVKLAKIAGLLPATIVSSESRTERKGYTLSSHDIGSYDSQTVETLEIITRARVPLAEAKRAEFVAFRARDGGPEHYALIVGDPLPVEPVLVRVHSECFTGDLLGSLKCDCGSQLRGAIDAISKSGSGILLYLAQEGRGIGLINKLRAYRLQDQGFDTLEANTRLGFEADERLYGIAGKMLSLLGYRSVRLLTNNPLKVEALQKTGIAVIERVPHSFPGNVHNREYLRTKAKAGHLL